MSIKSLLMKSEYARKSIFWIVNHLPFYNSIFGKKGNFIINQGGVLLHSNIRIKGRGNTVTIGDGVTLKNSKISIYGNDNSVIIGSGDHIRFGDIYIEDDGGQIKIGNKTNIEGRTHLACTEGCKICIGQGCLFSSDIVIRVGDSHSIVDLNGNRVNQSKDVVIGDHVWIGNKVTILKGVTVKNDTIIGTGAIVTNSPDKGNVVIAGTPAKIIKQDVNWDVRRLKKEIN